MSCITLDHNILHSKKQKYVSYAWILFAVNIFFVKGCFFSYFYIFFKSKKQNYFFVYTL